MRSDKEHYIQVTFSESELERALEAIKSERRQNAEREPPRPSALERVGDWLGVAAVLCVLGGWLPAITGDWLLLALAPVCFVASIMCSLFADERERLLEEGDLAKSDPDAGRPLRRLVEAERVVRLAQARAARRKRLDKEV